MIEKDCRQCNEEINKLEHVEERHTDHTLSESPENTPRSPKSSQKAGEPGRRENKSPPVTVEYSSRIHKSVDQLSKQVSLIVRKKKQLTKKTFEKSAS